jgi:hypothetical protein
VSSDLKQDIHDSIDDINDLLDAYNELFESVKHKKPDIIEIAALGTVLQSFYNGVEGIFLLIVKQIDKQTPNNSTWHQVLLNQVLESTSERDSVITLETASMLAPYMKFRHFFRHAYSFMLDWERLEPLIVELQTTWDATKVELISFCDAL